MKTKHKIYKTLCIDITTYKNNKTDINMNTDSLDELKSENKFICSICLNQKCLRDNKVSELNERKSRSCPICQCNCNYSTDDDNTLTKRSKLTIINDNRSNDNSRRHTQDVQTSHADVTQGLSLLNEVLNVFQTKKRLNSPIERKKTLIFKDVGVSTEEITNNKPRLSISKVFHFSIDDNDGIDNKFTIVNSSQPDTIFIVHKSLDLINHKSSSIPQMKLEELKKSLKKKTKSKDAIEEANRMFATVRRVEEKNEDENRPMIRSGPRVLPVVKTANFNESDNVKHEQKPKTDHTCKNHKNNYHMSSGDSSNRNKCCHICNKCKNGDDDCIYTMCCHYQHNRQQTQLICKRCRMAK